MGNLGGNAGHQGGNAGNQDGNAGNQGGNDGNWGGNVGNARNVGNGVRMWRIMVGMRGIREGMWRMWGTGWEWGE